ncbi:cell envelope biogenesis protein OmpA [Herbaspirillum lusitanum]|jgi:outer membrane protein OmpA-like peptidoglycan-associated protein|uniref:Cell envelope biogenesis protein OmpA n=1 Tax=Herbaspirillum lusitanum TaxID=213312 RepID=A0ABW9A4H9_9BURK
MEGGKEQNFWPGFVDALSNVVLVMIFVVVVFVVTLFYYSQKLAQMKVSKLVAQGQTQIESANVKTKSKVDPVNAPDGQAVNSSQIQSETRDRSQNQELEQLRREVAVLKTKLAAAPPLQSDAGSLRSDAAASNNAIQVKTEPTPKEIAPGVRVDGSSKSVVINFDNDSTQLNDAAAKSLDGSIGDWVRRAKASQGKIVVTGVIGSAEYSESRRRAYYRTVAVRNHLIDAGVDKERVVSRVATAENGAESNSRVIVQYLAAGAK